MSDALPPARSSPSSTATSSASSDAKRAVAIALRNRWRRQQLDEALREEVLPKNILMIGPTGCGKTEIARRLAKLAKAPFLKVEATKFTEVGYVGRDVEQHRPRPGRGRARHDARAAAQGRRAPRPSSPPRSACSMRCVGTGASEETRDCASATSCATASSHDREIEIEVADTGRAACRASTSRAMPGASDRHDQSRRHAGQGVRRAHQEAQDDGRREPTRPLMARGERQAARPGAGHRARRCEPVEQNGIVFLDEIDKITRAARAAAARDVSREGVQRDLLPLIEGTTVTTKHGAGEDRPHPVHRSRRLPPRQAVGPAARAAGPPADPGRACSPLTRDDLAPHPDRARGQPDQAVRGAAGDREGRARLQPTTRSTRWPSCRPTSTSRSRTSAPAGCTR